MRLALIADSFPPQRTSAAVQLRDLAQEFAEQGHDLTVILPDHEIQGHSYIEEHEGYRILRLRALQTKNIGYVRRTLNELLMPYIMCYNFCRSPLWSTEWEGVVWYSPSIFHGPFIKFLKRKSDCKSYLIIRDVFPEWAVDLGLMGKGVSYNFFKLIASYQYHVANIIGVQTHGNLVYFKNWSNHQGNHLEILPNWLSKPATTSCSLRLEETLLAGRKIFVYAGNMGVAQGMDIILNLAIQHQNKKDIGFLFVGRGSEVNRLKCIADQNSLDNVLFYDEISPDEIPDLYAQCHVGLVALSHKHKSHNIPGKFITYIQSGLPCLANINANNDLADFIRSNDIGCVCETNNIDDLSREMDNLLLKISMSSSISKTCEKVFHENFEVKNIAQRIILSLKGLS